MKCGNALLSSCDVPEYNDITWLSVKLLIHQFITSVSRKRKHTQKCQEEKHKKFIIKHRRLYLQSHIRISERRV